MEESQKEFSPRETLQLIQSMIETTKSSITLAILISYIIPGHLLRNKYQKAKKVLYAG
jgi:hypothetical protein